MNLSFLKNKKVIIGICIAAVVAIICTLFLFKKKNEEIIFNDLDGIDTNKFSFAAPRTDKPILYIKNGSLYSKASDGKGQSVDLSGNIYQNDIIGSAHEYTALVKQSKNADVTYFIKDYSNGTYRGALYATTDYQTSFQVDNDIVVEFEYDYLKMSEDGKNIVYMKNLNVTDDEVYADLYYKNIDSEEPILIANSLYGMQTEYIISPNGEYIAAYSKYNSESQTGGLYILKRGEASKNLIPENISSLSLLSLTNDGKLIYAATNTDATGTPVQSSVYILNHADMHSKSYGTNVAKDGVFVSEKSTDKLLYIEVIEDKVCVYSANYSSDPVLITDKYLGFTTIDVENEYYIFAQKDDEETTSANKKIYIKAPELAEPLLISDSIQSPSDIRCSIDYKTIYYLVHSNNNSGELYTVNFENGNLSSPEKISDNVYDYNISQGGKTVIFYTDYNQVNGSATLKFYSTITKEVKELKASAIFADIRLSADGSAALFATDENHGMFNRALYHCNLYTNDSKSSVIDNAASFDFYYYDQKMSSASIRNKFYVRGANNVLYYKDANPNYSGASLYLYIDGNNTLIDTDVLTLLFE